MLEERMVEEERGKVVGGREREREREREKEKESECSFVHSQPSLSLSSEERAESAHF